MTRLLDGGSVVRAQSHRAHRRSLVIADLLAVRRQGCHRWMDRLCPAERRLERRVDVRYFALLAQAADVLTAKGLSRETRKHGIE